jgi:hypothetical protein
MSAPARAAAACLAPGVGPRGFAMSRSNIRRGVGVMVGLVAMLLSSGAGAQDSQEMRSASGRCILRIPSTWIVTDSDRARSPDGRVTILISEVSSGSVFVNFQRAFGVEPSPSPRPDLTIMFARAGNMRRYFGVARGRSRRACIAQVTSSRAAGHQEAESIASTLRRQDR